MLKRLENPEKYREKGRMRYAKNKEQFRKAKYKWKLENEEKARLSKEKYRLSKKGKEVEKEYAQKYRKKNIDKIRAYQREDRKKKFSSNPELFILDRIRHSVQRITDGRKESRSLEYVGCSSVEEFLSKLSDKTDNKQWITDGYQVDHILQVHWFKDYIRGNPSDVESTSKVISHHSNLRPVSAEINAKRSYLDVSPITPESFLLVKYFLSEKIILAYETYIKNRDLFSGAMVLRDSAEETLLKKLMSESRS